MLTVIAPAKLNLTLEVLGKRDDGYHEIRSVIQAIDLCDRLTFQPSQAIEFESKTPGWIAEQSLVSRAALLLKDNTGCKDGAKITVHKKIPLLSGLGGDSSDAAATLYGLNKLWQLNLSQEELVSLAAQLGSDMPFFLYDGTALIKGRGEKVTPLPPIPQTWVVLLVPAVPRQPGKTQRLYSSLRPEHFTDGQTTEKLVNMIKDGRRLDLSLLLNTFENIAFDHSPEIRPYRDHMLKVGAGNVHLAGSGPALFTVTESEGRARELYSRLKEQHECYLAKTINAGQQ